MAPAEGGHKILKRKSSWHRRRRSKTLAVSLKHRKGRRGARGGGGGSAQGLGIWGGVGYPPPPPTGYGRCNTPLACTASNWRSARPLFGGPHSHTVTPVFTTRRPPPLPTPWRASIPRSPPPPPGVLGACACQDSNVPPCNGDPSGRPLGHRRRLAGRGWLRRDSVAGGRARHGRVRVRRRLGGCGLLGLRPWAPGARVPPGGAQSRRPVLGARRVRLRPRGRWDVRLRRGLGRRGEGKRPKWR